MHSHVLAAVLLGCGLALCGDPSETEARDHAVCEAVRRDDVQALNQAVETFDIAWEDDFFGIRCSCETGHMGLFRVAALHESNDAGRAIVIALDRAVGRDQLAYYFNYLDPIDGMTFLDWLMVNAEAHALEPESERLTRRAFVLMVENFRFLGGQTRCEMLDEEVCEQTVEAWLKVMKAGIGP